MIVHRVLNVDDRLPTNYFREKYKQYLKPTLLYPRQYYQDLLQQRTYSSTNNDKSLHRDYVSKLSSYRTMEIKSSPSSSISNWNQCVRRLNTEYRLTLDALEQAKQCLKQVSFHQQHLPPRSTNTIGLIRPCPPPPPSPMIKFAKPRLIKPVELQTFTVTEHENVESIGDIIKKFNRPRSPTARVHFEPSIVTHEFSPSCSIDVQEDDEEETTYTVETIYTQDFLPSIEPNLVVIQEKTTEEQFKSAQIKCKVPKKSVSHIPRPINSSRSKQQPPSSSSFTKSKLPISKTNFFFRIALLIFDIY